MSSRQLVRAFFRGAPCPRPPLLPLAFYHASRLDGTAPNLLAQDPTRLTRSLRDQQSLLDVDCVCVRFDAAFLAESAGAQVDWSPAGPAIQWASPRANPWPPDALSNGPVTVLLEVIRRLKIELRRQIPILAVIPGPMGLCGGDCLDRPDLLPETVDLTRMLAEAVCKAGAEVVLLEETAGVEEAAGVAEPVFNTVKYYNAFSLLQADALLFQPQIGLQGISGESRAGAFIPAECFESPELLKQYVSEVGSRSHPVFLTATDDVLVSHPIEANVSVFKALRHVEWG